MTSLSFFVFDLMYQLKVLPVELHQFYSRQKEHGVLSREPDSKSTYSHGYLEHKILLKKKYKKMFKKVKNSQKWSKMVKQQSPS